MSAANKILTVSYGTFSCTIEGFEDPFGTMKQIAEYFRDLAAEDRYFGAEPPVPDAEALRHIAERETARRVEARMASGAVHLRRLDDAAAAEAATPVAPVTPVVPQTAGQTVSPTVSLTGAAPAPAAVLSPSEVIDPAPASVAERLSRIRAVVARARTQPLWPDEDATLAAVVPAAAAVASVSDTMAPVAEASVTPVQARDAWADVVAADVVLADVVLAEEAAADDEPTDLVRADAAEAAPADAWADLQDDLAVADAAPADVTMAAEGTAEGTAEAFDDDDPVNEAPSPDDWTPAPTVAGAEALPDSVATPAWDEDDDSLVAPPVGAQEPATVAAAQTEPADVATNAEPAVEPHPGADMTTGSAAAADVRGDTLADWQAAAVPAGDYVRPELPVARVAVLRKDDHAAATATGQLEDLLAGRIAITDLYDDEADAPATATTGDTDDGLLAAIRAVGVTARETGVDAGSAAADPDPDNTEPAETDVLHDDVAYGHAAQDAADEVADGAKDWPSKDWPSKDLSGDWNAVDTADDQPDVMDWPASAAEQPDAEHLYARQSGRDAPATDLSDLASDDDDDAFDLDTDGGAPLLLRAADEVEAINPPDLGPEDDTEARTGHEQAVEDLERQPEDASVDRLLAATNSQLESTEVNRRRSAIAHLKAAVAAARADRRTEERAEPEEDTGGSALDKFREDLARVVRPRRPIDQDQPRPTRRLPPLMLVSEQRIDVGMSPARNEDAVSGPVRPRRVVTRDVGDDMPIGATPVAQGGFADFAESMGARDLPDMIEAAAAYTAFVEGRPSFSRPQLMQMMRAGDSDDAGFSREEQLRSFGLLLRQGRIQKLKRGQFTVADDTRFRPHRHAGE